MPFVPPLPALTLDELFGLHLLINGMDKVDVPSGSDVGKTSGFEGDLQERILEASLVQNGGFMKAQGMGPMGRRAAGLPRAWEGGPFYTRELGVGGRKQKGDFKRIFLC